MAYLRRIFLSNKEHLFLFARGFCMGAADLVPGVSGGTMAFILGIYQPLLDALHTINLEFARLLVALRWREAFQRLPWRFLLALGFGIATAILSLSRPIHWALGRYPSLVWAFFFGLVLASVLVVRKRIRHWSPFLILVATVALLLTYFLVGLIPIETPNTPLFTFLSGAIAICAMILPGISGAFILVLLGKYSYILSALIRFDLLVLFTFAAGCVIGLLSFVRILRWLLNRFPDPTVAALTGLMIGSLRKVWPWQLPAQDGSLSFALLLPHSLSPYDFAVILCIGLGFFIVLGLEKLAASRSGEK